MKRSLYQLSLRRYAVAIIAFIVTMVMLVVIAAAGEVSTAERTVEENATIAALESLGLSTEEYEDRLEKLAEYREFLKANDCQEINLDFCADFIYSVNMCDGFKDPNVFDRWKESILSNFVSVDEILEFGRTCKVDENWNWRVLYFKDEKGKATREPAIAYVYNPENRHFKVSDIEQIIGWWTDRGSDNYLETQVANNVRVILQSQASSNESVGTLRYGWGIVYINNSDNDEGLKSTLIGNMSVEQYGARVETLSGDTKNPISALLKARAALSCCQYLLYKTGDEKLKVWIKKYESEINRYNDKYVKTGQYTIAEVEDLLNDMKREGLITPFGAETWEEIDAAIGGN